MSHSKLKFVVPLAVFTSVAFLLTGCDWGSGKNTNGTSSSEGKIGGLGLKYFNKYTAELEDIAEPLTVEFSGKRKLGPGESETKGDSFEATGSGDTKEGASTIATFLNTGEWEVSIKDAGVWLKCQKLVIVKSDPTNVVTFHWNGSNKFETCETTY